MFNKNNYSIKKLLILTFISFCLTACFYRTTNDHHLISPDKIDFPPLKLDLPQAQRVALKNGIIIYILEDHELPLVNINALIKTGSVYDPKDKEGVADLTAYVMRTGGTKKLESEKLDHLFDLLAASASISMSSEYASAEFSILSKDLDKGLDIFSQIIITPAFEKNKLQLAVKLKKEDLRRLQDDPQRLAFRNFSRLIYHNDPRGRFPSYKSLNQINRNDLVKFHHRFFQPNNIMFSVTGDITKEQAIKLFTKYFGRWEKSAPLIQKVPLPKKISNAGVYYFNKNISQSTIVAGQFAPGKHHPDYYAFVVLDFIAGSGGFNSRIFNAVRNKEGLAYSAGSFYRARPDFGVFGTYALTKSSSTLQTLSLINSELESIKSQTITQNELEWAKKSINNGFIFSFTNAENIAWQQMKNEFEKMPSDYLSKYPERIESVKLEDLNRLADLYLNKDKNVVLILGNYKNFDKPTSMDNTEFTLINNND